MFPFAASGHTTDPDKDTVYSCLPVQLKHYQHHQGRYTYQPLPRDATNILRPTIFGETAHYHYNGSLNYLPPSLHNTRARSSNILFDHNHHRRYHLPGDSRRSRDRVSNEQNSRGWKSGACEEAADRVQVV